VGKGTMAKFIYRNFNLVEMHCCASKKVDKIETHTMRLYIKLLTSYIILLALSEKFTLSYLPVRCTQTGVFYWSEASPR